ncbi:hypothetical protein [Lacticaseibacillus porcinae]|uniref:hypothetical protein n=1 Tax=Lacticaseibacillus porcinae TaxID=1123687 RepID=UPI000F7A3263|nr:hypothetical protein [Lacticaseibacillus porcinae]
MGASLLHNMLLRELVLVALLVIVLISFYIRFRAAGKKEYVRTRERRLAQVVSSARKQIIVVLVLLAAVLVYDRVLPHFGIGAQAAQTATSSSTATKKPTKKEQSSRLKKAQSVSKQAKSLSQSISKSSSVAAKASAASASKASSSAEASSASAAKASSASSRSQATVDPKVKAVAAVRAHMAQNPSEYDDTRIDGVSVIDYTTDYTGVPAYEVGLDQTQADGTTVAVHMYFYYGDGSVAKAY